MSIDPGAAAAPGADTAAAPAGDDVPSADEAVSVAPGAVVAYLHHDPYATVGAGDRHQLVLVIGAADGQVFGIPLGYADEAAAFDAGELVPLDEL
jgi:hypothetical protein